MKRAAGTRAGGILQRLTGYAVRRYFVGPQVEDAAAVHQRLVDLGFETTWAYWDASPETAAEVIAAYCRALEALQTTGSNSYLSVKPWAFGFDRGAFAELLSHARHCGVQLHFDSLRWEWADTTIALAEAAGGGRDLGFTLPARWERSRQDVDRLEGLGGAVRVVKGQYPQPNGSRRSLRRRYVALVEQLAAGPLAVRVATHDPRLAVPALRSGGSCASLELLYGLPVERVLPAAVNDGKPVRMYLPFGTGYLPYGLSALRRRPRIAWWLLRDALCAALARQDRIPALMAAYTQRRGT